VYVRAQSLPPPYPPPQDPQNLDAYIRNNIFLPDINNEKEDKSPQYADNLASLQRLVLYRFDEDTTGERVQY
jgi:palmitoyl-protein thioesterase